MKQFYIMPKNKVSVYIVKRLLKTLTQMTKIVLSANNDSLIQVQRGFLTKQIYWESWQSEIVCHLSKEKWQILSLYIQVQELDPLPKTGVQCRGYFRHPHPMVIQISWIWGPLICHQICLKDYFINILQGKDTKLRSWC